MKRLTLAALLLVPAAWAGPLDQPYAIITSDRAPSADPLLRYVTINRVDGQPVAAADYNKSVVPPGKRQVIVDLPPRQGLRVATQRTFQVEASACMRYFVMAKLESATSENWTPVVRSSELIPECQTQFKSFERK
jgi:hypothetical protein